MRLSHKKTSFKNRSLRLENLENRSLNAADLMMTYADVNGDGKSDAISLQVSDSNTVARVSIADGSGGFQSAGNGIWFETGSAPLTCFKFADVNGDRRSDLIFIKSGFQTEVIVGLSDGNSFRGNGFLGKDGGLR